MIYSAHSSQLFKATSSSQNRIKDKMAMATMSEDLHVLSNRDL